MCLTLARKFDTVHRNTVKNKSSNPTMRLHFAHVACFPFQLRNPCSSSTVSCENKGDSKTCALFAGIGGSRLAI